MRISITKLEDIGEATIHHIDEADFLYVELGEAGTKEYSQWRISPNYPQGDGLRIWRLDANTTVTVEPEASNMIIVRKAQQ